MSFYYAAIALMNCNGIEYQIDLAICSGVHNSSSLLSTPLIIDNIDCSIDSCSLTENTKTDLILDYTGLSLYSGISFVIYESNTKAILRGDWIQGNESITYTLINVQTAYDVVFGE